MRSTLPNDLVCHGRVIKLLAICLLSLVTTITCAADKSNAPPLSYKGACSVNSITGVKGVEGASSAKILEKQLSYGVTVNAKEATVNWKNRKETFTVKESEGEFGAPKSLVIYSSGSSEVWIIFRENGLEPVFHTEDESGKFNTWGTCLFIESKLGDTLDRIVSAAVYDSLKKEDFLKMNRNTVAGQLSSCELEFQYSYQDVRSQKGKPILLTGAFAIFNQEKKPISYLLKITANKYSEDSSGWVPLKPEFTNITVNDKSFLSNQYTEFTCESGGRCVGFFDTSLELTKALTKNVPFEGKVSLSLTKNGIDHTFSLTQLIKKEASRAERMSFHSCVMELLKKNLNEWQTRKG